MNIVGVELNQFDQALYDPGKFWAVGITLIFVRG